MIKKTSVLRIENIKGCSLQFQLTGWLSKSKTEALEKVISKQEPLHCIETIVFVNMVKNTLNIDWV